MPVTIDGTTGITAPAIDVATPVTTADGGTGLSSFTTNGAMYATSTSALTTGTLPVASGGTGAATLTSNNVLLGNGTSAVQFVAPGSSGNVLTSNGTTWTSAAAGGGQIQTEVFSSPGTWTKPASATQVRVTVVGGGGGSSFPGGPQAGGSGGTSSFGPAVSATGGAGGTGSVAGANGTGTVSVGTTLRNTHAGSTVHHIVNGISNLPSAANPQIPSPSAPARTYSPTDVWQAGRGGLVGYNSFSPTSQPGGGNGGVAIAIVPVSAPVAITVGGGGAGASPGATSVSGGVSGAIVVEFVG